VRVIAISWNQLVSFADQVKLEQRLWVLVACKFLVDLLLALFGPWKFILVNQEIAI
jgi:hypothetical protein